METIMKKIYKTQDEVLTQKQLITLLSIWIFAFCATYFINSIAPMLTAFATEIVFISYMLYADFRYTSIPNGEE